MSCLISKGEDPYQALVGIVLVFAAYRLFWYADQPKTHPKDVPRMLALLFGAGLGFVSGLTGIGGGIFLSPLLLVMGWAEPRQSASVSAAFILVNSIAGLFGETLEPVSNDFALTTEATE